MPSFTRPEFLPALLVLPLLWSWMLFFAGKKPQTNLWPSATLRCVALGAAILAVAGPFSPNETPQGSRWVALSVSSGNTPMSLPQEWMSALEQEKIPLLRVLGDVSGREAEISAFLESGGAAVLVFSPPEEAEMVQRLARLDRHSLPWSVIPLPDAGSTEPILLGATVPDSPPLGENFSVTFRIAARQPGAAELRIFLDGELQKTMSLELEQGVGEFIAEGLSSQSRPARLQAFLTLQGADWESDVSLTRFLLPEDAFQALVLATDLPEASEFWRPLEETSLTFRFLEPSELEFLTPGDPAPDIVILSNLAASMLPSHWLAWMERFVFEQGGAVLATGGGRAFEEGGYSGTRLGALLPLDSGPGEPESRQEVVIMVVLDRSGSMAALVGNETKMDLANEGTVRVLENLPEDGILGVIAGDTLPQTMIPLERGQNRREIAQRIRSISVGGGGIYVYPALREAWNQLQAYPQARRHLILFTDADDTEEKWEGETAGLPRTPGAIELAAILRAAGVGISIVALGERSGKDVPWLEELAERGAGRFHLTPDASELPTLFEQESRRLTPRRMLSPRWEVALTASGARLFPELQEDPPPRLGAFNETTAKPGADVWLMVRSETNAPLLAFWRRGLGRVAAMATEFPGPWSGEWATWESGASFRENLLSSLLSRRLESEWEIRITREDPTAGMIEVKNYRLDSTAPPQGAPRLFLQPFPEGKREIPLAPHAPGIFRAALPASAAPGFLQLVGPDGMILRESVLHPPDRTPQVSPTDGAALLQSLAENSGGAWNPQPHISQLPSRISHPIPWATLLWSFAAVLFFVEAAFVSRGTPSTRKAGT